MPSYEGYAEYTGYRFDVWESGWFGDKKVGNGTALKLRFQVKSPLIFEKHSYNYLE
ncbi:hypothetical protein ACT453_16320 [Bacillus sp. D-CC]